MKIEQTLNREYKKHPVLGTVVAVMGGIAAFSIAMWFTRAASTTVVGLTAEQQSLYYSSPRNQ